MRMCIALAVFGLFNMPALGQTCAELETKGTVLEKAANKCLDDKELHKVCKELSSKASLGNTLGAEEMNAYTICIQTDQVEGGLMPSMTANEPPSWIER
jgi:hypothetical protein